MEQSRRSQEKKYKTITRDRLEEDAKRGGSEHLARRAQEASLKRDKSALKKADPKATEKSKKNMANEEMNKKA